MKSSRPADRLVAGLLALLLAAAWGGVAQAADDDELLGALKRVEKVRIEGNEAISDGTLKKVLKTGSSSFLGLRSPPIFRPDFLRTDAQSIQNLYARRGYLDASVSASADSGTKPGRVIVTYHVREGPQVEVRRVEVDSTTMFTADRIRREIKLTPGKPFDPVQLVLDRAAIGLLYGEQGHFPEVRTDVRRDSTQMDVRFIVFEGPPFRVRSVAVSGVQAVDTAAVRRELLMHTGDLFRRDRLLKSSERLYETGLFTTVEINPTDADTVAGTVDLNVRIRERKPRLLEGGVGVGTEQRIRLGAQWMHRNIGGDGKILTVGMGLGWYRDNLYNAKLQTALTEPWLFGLRLRGTVAGTLQHGFDIFGSRTYVQEAAGISFGLKRQWYSPRSEVSLVLDNTWNRLAEVIVEDPNDTTTFSLPGFVQRVTLGYNQDLRDDAFNPRSGSLLGVSLQFTGNVENGQGRYWRPEAAFGGHIPKGKRAVFSARLRASTIVAFGEGVDDYTDVLGRVPVTDRLRVGGSGTVRGFRDNGIDYGGEGGLLLLVTNAEYRVAFTRTMSGAVFVDGGNVWNNPADFKLSRLVETSGVDHTVAYAGYRWAYGLGVLFMTPVGPLRADWARRLHEEESDALAGREPTMTRWHISLGFFY